MAVSGGVDSMVLLDVLSQQPNLELVVAHFDHGIRTDSDKDRQLVEQAAKRYGLPFIYERGILGPSTSEAVARAARYRFLRKVQQDNAAQAIITAHHQDDLIETVIINLIRGTGRKGLSSLASNDDMVRPLLHVRKQNIYDEASQITKRDPAFTWHTDSTNESDAYLRNYIRHHIIQDLGEQGRELLLSYSQKAAESNPLIDSLLLHNMNNRSTPTELNRYWFIMLPHDVSREVMAAWLRQNNLRQFDRKLVERLVTAAKVAFPGKVADITAGYLLNVNRATLKITPRTSS